MQKMHRKDVKSMKRKNAGNSLVPVGIGIVVIMVIILIVQIARMSLKVV